MHEKTYLLDEKLGALDQEQRDLLCLEQREVGDGVGRLLLVEGVVGSILGRVRREQLLQHLLQRLALFADVVCRMLAIEAVHAGLDVVLDLVSLLLGLAGPLGHLTGRHDGHPQLQHKTMTKRASMEKA